MKKINLWFDCIWCGESVSPAEKTSRNHCSKCFLSLHVDGELPGDRASSCSGLMIPIEYVIANGKTKIHFICVNCGKDHRNKTASDDEIGSIDRVIVKWKKKYANVIEI